MTTLDFLVRQDQLEATALRSGEEPPLSLGEIRLGIDKFALTSNNITYAAFGKAMNYWSFFPSAPDDAGWGRIPVWGFATVVQSLHTDVAAGERLYGYFPMSNSVIVQPVRVSASGFSDGASHRANLHPVYNQYLRCRTDPFYTPESEDVQAVLRPLFITSWLIDDFLADSNFFGATDANGRPGTVLLSSASSKTAYGTAFQLAQRQGLEIVGLTSSANVAFCESLGCYQRVLSYEQLDRIDADAPCIYIDFAGHAEFRRAVHSRFRNLKYSSSIGGTHVGHLGGASGLPGPRPTLFFAPAQIKKRNADWGPEDLNARLLQAWRSFVSKVSDPTHPWLLVQQHHGAAAVEQAYQRILGGRADPRQAHMLSLS